MSEEKNEDRAWQEQVTRVHEAVLAALRAVEARLATLEARVAVQEATTHRLDTHSGELAREVLDVTGRVDGLDAKVEGVGDSLVAHQDRAGRHG